MPTQENVSPDNILITAAKTIGTTAGKIAATLGITSPPKHAVAKLVKKKKSRLPRRQKKAAKKAVEAARLSGS